MRTYLLFKNHIYVIHAYIHTLHSYFVFSIIFPIGIAMELWLENSRDGLSLSALHIHPADRAQVFDATIEIAQTIGLKPFPDYVAMLS